MKHVGELAVIGALFNAVETRRVRTTQGRRYLTKRIFFVGFCCTHITE